MAVLCWLIEAGEQPEELHLFYAHLKEHSPDTFQFVADGIRLARKHFRKVVVKITRNSVLAYFREQNMIPHPTFSPCSRWLKIEPMALYAMDNNISIDLIGYVKNELKRVRRMEASQANTLFLTKEFPIRSFTDEWCFEIVDSHIGWHPAIYDILDDKGKRKFKHNNCLPCKNMWLNDMIAVRDHFPDYMDRANKLSQDLKSYWGREADAYYTEFGRADYEPGICEACQFD